MNEKQLEQFITMKNDITNIKSDVAEIKETLNKFIESSEKKIEEVKNDSEKRFANKWVEKVWIWVFSAIGTGIVGAIAYAIIHAYSLTQ